jgi:hypothetical protein
MNSKGLFIDLHYPEIYLYSLKAGIHFWFFPGKSDKIQTIYDIFIISQQGQLLLRQGGAV